MYILRNSLCALFNVHLQICCCRSQVEIAPFTHRSKTDRIYSNVDKSWTVGSVSPTSERIGIHSYLSHSPPALCISWWHHVVLQEWLKGCCDCSTSLHPALRPWLVVILFLCIKVCPLHFGRLHNWVYLQLFSTRNPHPFVSMWFCALVHPYRLSSDHLFCLWGRSWLVLLGSCTECLAMLSNVTEHIDFHIMNFTVGKWILQKLSSHLGSL